MVSGHPDLALPTQAIVEQVVSQVSNGSIVVFHVSGTGRHTAAVLPVIINQLREQRYAFVTVSQLPLAGEQR